MKCGATLLLLSAMPLTACDKGAERVMRGEAVLAETSVETSTHGHGASKAKSMNSSLLEALALADAFAKLEAAAKPPVAALELVITPSELVLQAQDPNRPSEVVQHVYRGGQVAAARRVELRGSGDLADNLFPLADVNIAAIPDLAEKASAGVDPQDGRVSRVVVRRNLPFDDAIGIRVYVDSPRKAGHLDADRTGKILSW